MSISNKGGSRWDAAAQATAQADAWQATRAQTALATQFLRDKDDYLADEKRDIGRQMGANVCELFVSCDAAQAMQQQFEHLHPEFIAVHDLGTESSRKLLAGIASASGRSVQKLIIRRQGFGTPLATLEFIELPTTEGRALRMYTTEAESDTATRYGLARILLAYSRLGVLMVGDLPSNSISASLKPLRDDILTGPWRNRHLLLLPLASGSAVVSQGMDLGRGTGVNVRTAPPVTRPAEAWSFVHSTWMRLRDQTQPDARTMPALADLNNSVLPPDKSSIVTAPTVPQTGTATREAYSMAEADTEPAELTMRPMPEIAGGAKSPEPLSIFDRYVRQLSDLTGMVSCCVFDISTGRDLAHAGASPAGQELALHGAELLAALSVTSRNLGLGYAVPDAAITLGAHHLLLRSVPKHRGLALHAVLDKSHANLTLARLQVARMDALFDDAPAGT